MMGLLYTLGIDTSPMVRGFAAAQGMVRGFSGSIGAAAMVGAGTAFAAVGAAALGMNKAIRGAADMEKMSTSFEVLLGSGQKAAQMLKDLSSFAAATPFELPEIAQATKKLLAFGIAQDQVLGTLRSVGDIASAIDAPISEIAEIYGKARVQGRLFAEDMNQLTGRGIPIIQELAKQFGVSESAVKGLVESGSVGFANLQKAFADLTANGAKFGGMMDKQSRTWSGMMSTLKDNVNAVFRELGQPIMVGLKPALASAIAMTEKLMGVIKSGNTGEALGLSLKIGMGDALNFFVSGLRNAGVGLIATIYDAMGDVVATMTLIAAPSFWTGVGKALVAASHSLSAVIMRGISSALDLIPGMGKAATSASDFADSEERKANRATEEGQALIKAPFRKSMEEINAQVNRLMDDAFNGTLNQETIDTSGFKEQLAALLSKSITQATAKIDGMNTSGAGGAGIIGKGKSKDSPGDRLAKMGLFIGRGGPSGERAAIETARNTKETVSLLKTYVNMIGSPAIQAGAVF